MLSQISRVSEFTESDKNVLELIVNKYCAPIEHKKKRSKYSPAALLKLKDILENQPDILALFGMDPESARREL